MDPLFWELEVGKTEGGEENDDEERLPLIKGRVQSTDNSVILDPQHMYRASSATVCPKYQHFL